MACLILLNEHNGKYLNRLLVDGLQVINDNNRYKQPQFMAMQLSYKEVWLDFFYKCQQRIYCLKSGDELLFLEKGCCTKNGDPIIHFSKLFVGKIAEMKGKGYVPKKAIVKHIVYWKKADKNKEIRIVLPEVYFIRTNGQKK